MEGTIPATINDLEHLTVLYLEDAGSSDCPLSRPNTTIPEVTKLSKLEVLHLSLTSLVGSLPPTIGQLGALRELFISQDILGTFGGQIPQSLWRLGELRKLTFTNGNSFDSIGLPSQARPFPLLESLFISGSLPWKCLNSLIKTSPRLQRLELESKAISPSLLAIRELVNLTFLDISSTAASGAIPPNFWKSLPNLKVVDVSDTALSGTLSANISSLQHLRHLDVSLTQLSGTVPSALMRCPLETLNLNGALFTQPLPNTLGQLAQTLITLKAANLRGRGTVPQSITELTKLKTLALSGSGFVGTLPAHLSDLPLVEAYFDNNGFTGSLPDLPYIQDFDAHNNAFTGTVPRSIAVQATTIILSHNNLGPSIPEDLFNSSLLRSLVLSHNLFSGPLPQFNAVSPPNVLDLSYNAFNGTIPVSYCEIGGLLQLSGNRLSGPLESLFSARCPLSQLGIFLDGNTFEGTFPPIQRPVEKLDISYNRFIGPLPSLPPNLKSFKAQDNMFSTESFSTFAESVQSGSLEQLDLSGLGLTSFADPADRDFSVLVGSRMKYLSLANNGFYNARTAAERRPQLRGLDLTNNSLTGQFDTADYPNIAILKLAHNSLSGELYVNWMTFITHLDVSFNKFHFDVSSFVVSFQADASCHEHQRSQQLAIWFTQSWPVASQSTDGRRLSKSSRSSPGFGLHWPSVRRAGTPIAQHQCQQSASDHGWPRYCQHRLSEDNVFCPFTRPPHGHLVL